LPQIKRVAAIIALPALVALAALAAAPAPAAAPPSVTTAAATSPTTSGATLNGTVNPNGVATQYAFQWGPTSGYGHETALTSAGAGSTQSSVSSTLAGLPGGTTFHYRIIAMSAAGTSVGGDLTFLTAGSPPPPSPGPTAATGSTSALTASSATLAGTVDPKGQSTQYVFEYGTTSDYGTQTAPAGAGSGSGNASVSANLVNLAASTTYHYRVVAYSAGGTALGGDHTFTTLTPPAAQTGSTSSVDSSSATVNGLVNPLGHSTSYQFQFGTSPFLGISTPPAGVGSGTGELAVHQSLTGLAANTTYYYRITASSSQGTSYGQTLSFKTAGGPLVTSSIKALAGVAFVGSNGVVGVGLGCFGGQTSCMATMTLTRGHTVYAQRSFTLSADDGGFAHASFSAASQRVLFHNYHGPVKIRLNVKLASGQGLSQVIQLARWY